MPAPFCLPPPLWLPALQTRRSSPPVPTMAIPCGYSRKEQAFATVVASLKPDGSADHQRVLGQL